MQEKNKERDTRLFGYYRMHGWQSVVYFLYLLIVMDSFENNFSYE